MDNPYEGGECSTPVRLLGGIRYNKKMHVFSMRADFNLMSMKTIVGDYWPEINREELILTYSAPHAKDHEVRLLNDEDVSNMIELHKTFNLTYVDIRATDRDDVTEHMGSTSFSLVRCRAEDTGLALTPQSDAINSNSRNSWSMCINGVGQGFRDAAEFRRKLKNYSVSIHRTFKYIKNDSLKIIAVCLDSTCKWRIYASYSKKDLQFAIRKCCLQHTCREGSLRSKGHPRADANWVANIVREKVRSYPKYSPKEMKADIGREFAVEVPYKRVWNGKEIAMYDIHGYDGASYDRVRWYCDAVRKTNPGSFVDYEVDTDTQKFTRLFLCFHACLLGFLRGCRKLIFLDGTHIKNHFKGCLLSAVTKDGNDGLFTLAYAVVSAENDANWEWFCRKLHEALASQTRGLISFKSYTFFSDRHSGLRKAVPTVFPGSNHAYCLRHLVDNFRTQILRFYPYKNKKHWEMIFQKAAYTTSFNEYRKFVDEIVKAMPRAEDFILQSEPQNWANCLFSGERFGVINNNVAESWNSWVNNARVLPMLGLVDQIRVQIMIMMKDRRDLGEKYNIELLCPHPEEMLRQNYAEGRKMTLNRASPFLFEVSEGKSTYAVNLETRTCTCKQWQIFRIACKHACACIEDKGLSLYDFCDEAYSVAMYRDAYRLPIYPIPTGEELALVENENDQFVYPPDVRVQPGRRRQKRIPSQVVKRDLTCSRCKRKGHNRRGCKEPLQA